MTTRLSCFVLAASLASCAELQSIADLRRVEFQLADVASPRLAGIDLASKHAISDFTVEDGLRLADAFRRQQLPLSLTVDVAARNPNSPRPEGDVTATITQFPWRLLVDDRETVSGGIGAPVRVPGGGQTTTIPLVMEIDLKKFFADKGYDDLLGLALAIAHQGTSRLALRASPTVASPLGSIRYPGELTIVSHEFRAQ
jgi:hypothetical protein